MSKILDWSTIAQVNFDEKRRKSTGITTMRQSFQKAHAQLEKTQQLQARRKELEPILKSKLINYMVSREPIKVLFPIQNPTESLGGLTKADEEDGFYANTSASAAAGGKTASSSFEEVMEVIPAGIELVYKSMDKTLGQFLFKGSNGVEYAIYDKNVILFKGSAMENPGLFGLLFHTNLVDSLEDLGD